MTVEKKKESLRYIQATRYTDQVPRTKRSWNIWNTSPLIKLYHPKELVAVGMMLRALLSYATRLYGYAINIFGNANATSPGGGGEYARAIALPAPSPDR